MSIKSLKAFIGHSFNDEDAEVVDGFLKYFESLSDIGFEWDHAEKAAAKELAMKVKEKMEGKNVFIGIFTKKNRQINNSQLVTCFFKKTALKAPLDQFHWTTSDWVVQESGYALGKGLDLIFIIEQGVEQVGGLQGNLEYVPFDRKNISKSFSKLNEMITSLMREKESAIQTESKDKIALEQPTDSVELREPTDEAKGEITRCDKRESITSFSRMMNGFLEKDVDSQEQGFKAWLSEQKTEFDKIASHAYYLWLKYTHANKDVLNEMIELSKKHPEHPAPYLWLGRLYREYKEHRKASEYYLSAARYEKEADSQTRYICIASDELSRAGSFEEARKLLMERLTTIKGESSEQIYSIYKSLSEIESSDNSTIRKLALLEKALALKPIDNGMRFDLAYAYSGNNNNLLALHHYLILTESNPTSAGFNNLGVAYSEAGIEGKSVDAYLESKRMGGTTAVGNLAYKLIDKGFYQQAREMLQAVISLPDCDANVSKAMTHVSELSKNEDGKEKDVLLKVPRDIDFLIDYAEAYVDVLWTGTLLKKWKNIRCSINISITNDDFYGEGQFDASMLNALQNIYAYPSSNPGTTSVTKEVIIRGKKANRVVDFTLTVRNKNSKESATESLAGSILSNLADMDEKKFSGQMIISSDSSKIQVRELDSKGNSSYYEMIAE